MGQPTSQEDTLQTLDAAGLLRFQQIQNEAVNAVTERFYATLGSAYERFGPSGRKACREDLAFHLEFLRPVLEFGLLKPMVDYLRWLDSVLAARTIPSEHLALSLDWLAEFFAGQMAAADAAIVVAALQAARRQFLTDDAIPTSLPAPEAWPETDELEAALLAGQQHAAFAVMNRCMDAGRSLLEVEQHIIQPALYRIGEKWQANQVSVAQEHLASAIVQAMMTIGLLRCAPPAPVDKRVLLACVEGNNHALGLRMVADAFQLAGWEIQYLGANVPTAALVRQVATGSQTWSDSPSPSRSNCKPSRASSPASANCSVKPARRSWSAAWQSTASASSAQPSEPMPAAPMPAPRSTTPDT
jgi:methanogenic corrinoid protein MtbC1